MTEKKPHDKLKRASEPNRVYRLWFNFNLTKRALEPGFQERWYKIALLTAFSLLAAIMVFPRPQAPHFDFQVGDIAISKVNQFKKVVSNLTSGQVVIVKIRREDTVFHAFIEIPK